MPIKFDFSLSVGSTASSVRSDVYHDYDYGRVYHRAAAKPNLNGITSIEVDDHLPKDIKKIFLRFCYHIRQLELEPPAEPSEERNDSFARALRQAYKLLIPDELERLRQHIDLGLNYAPSYNRIDTVEKLHEKYLNEDWVQEQAAISDFFAQAPRHPNFLDDGFAGPILSGGTSDDTDSENLITDFFSNNLTWVESKLNQAGETTDSTENEALDAHKKMLLDLSESGHFEVPLAEQSVLAKALGTGNFGAISQILPKSYDFILDSMPENNEDRTEEYRLNVISHVNNAIQLIDNFWHLIMDLYNVDRVLTPVRQFERYPIEKPLIPDVAAVTNLADSSTQDCLALLQEQRALLAQIEDYENATKALSSFKAFIRKQLCGRSAPVIVEIYLAKHPILLTDFEIPASKKAPIESNISALEQQVLTNYSDHYPDIESALEEYGDLDFVREALENHSENLQRLLKLREQSDNEEKYLQCCDEVDAYIGSLEDIREQHRLENWLNRVKGLLEKYQKQFRPFRSKKRIETIERIHQAMNADYDSSQQKHAAVLLAIQTEKSSTHDHHHKRPTFFKSNLEILLSKAEAIEKDIFRPANVV